MFTDNKQADKLHEKIVEITLHNSIVGDLNRDSTAIATKEKTINKKKDVKEKPRKRGRPQKGEERAKKNIRTKQRFLLPQPKLNVTRYEQQWKWQIHT